MKPTTIRFAVCWIGTVAWMVSLLCNSTAQAKKPSQPPGGGAPTFNLHPNGFDDSSAFDVNDGGFVVGRAGFAGIDIAVAWTTNSSGLITTTFLDDGAYAYGVNAYNEIAGHTIRPDLAHEARYWPAPTAVAKVLPGFGGEGSGALAISDSGIIAGWSGTTPVVWRIDNGVVRGPYALPTNGLSGAAEAITSAGDTVVGTIYDGITPLATVWTIEVLASGDVVAISGPVTPFGNTWSRGLGVSAAGSICGAVNDGVHAHAFVLWGGGLELLEENPKTTFSMAWDVNISEAVGEQTTSGRRAGTDDKDAVLWNNLGLNNLDGDVQDAGFYDSLTAYGLSESGIVVGTGVQNGWGRAFVRY